MLYGDLYNHDNVMLLPQHSHSTPGGMHTYYMYQAPSLGFINETFTAYAEGIVEVCSPIYIYIYIYIWSIR